MERLCEFRLRHAKFAADGVNRNNQLEMVERNVGVFAVFDSLSTDFFVCRCGDFGAVDSVLFRPQFV